MVFFVDMVPNAPALAGVVLLVVLSWHCLSLKGPGPDPWVCVRSGEAFITAAILCNFCNPGKLPAKMQLTQIPLPGSLRAKSLLDLPVHG